jgi:hypothetical protein
MKDAIIRDTSLRPSLPFSSPSASSFSRIRRTAAGPPMTKQVLISFLEAAIDILDAAEEEEDWIEPPSKNTTSDDSSGLR